MSISGFRDLDDDVESDLVELLGQVKRDEQNIYLARKIQKNHQRLFRALKLIEELKDAERMREAKRTWIEGRYAEIGKWIVILATFLSAVADRVL